MTPGVVAETDLAGTTKSEYVFFDGECVARRDGVNGTSGVFYYFSDHLKTASVNTDPAGVIKAESDYHPWGGELQFVNNDTNAYKFTGTRATPKPASTLGQAGRYSVCWLIFSSTPTLASIMNRLDPPYEINGSGIPLVGSSASTTLMLKKACTTIIVVTPMAI
jgi:hypothetical protein